MPTTTSNLEHMILDGPIGLPIAIVLALVLLGLFTWSLSRERFILGTRYTIIFWLLRAVALGVAIWMLLDPTRVLVEVSTTRKSVAVLMDVSGSMQTIDPEGTSDELRWALSQSDNASVSAVQLADQAHAAAGLAERHLQKASDALQQHQRESLVVDEVSVASQAIGSLQKHMATLVEELRALGSEKTDVSLKGMSREISRELSGAEFVAFEELSASLKKGRAPSEKGWRESLPDLQNRLAGLRRKLSELARDLTDREAELTKSRNPGMLSAIQRASRIDRAAGFLDRLNASLRKAVGDKADIRVQTFDQAATLVSSERTLKDVVSQSKLALEQDSEERREASARAGTNLSSVLEQLNRDRQDQPLAAAILLTDVSHNKSGSVNPRDAAAELDGTPVYVVPIGNTQYVRDILVQSVFCPAVAMRNDNIVIEAVIQAYECESESCQVQLLRDGQVIDSRTIQLDSSFATRRVRFDQKMADVGMQRFQVQVSAVPGELTEQNNSDNFEVNVTRSEIKLLLADEMPRWEYHYLAQLFRRDPKVELDELLFHPQLRATGRRSSTKAFPVTADDWDQYDVVILGDIKADHLPPEAQKSLITYMQERGGTVILIAGKESMPEAYATSPLMDVLPVTRVDAGADVSDESGYAFHVTDAGQSHNALMIGETDEATRVAWDFINQFAPLHHVSPWRLPRPSATTLISAVPRGSLDQDHANKTSAFLCWQPIGRGRVVYLSGPETFRLRFLRGDRLHYRFWGQMLRWALASDLSAGTELVRIRSDKPQYQANESIQVVVRLTDKSGNPLVTTQPLQAMARQSDQEHSTPLVADELIPGQYVGTFKSLPPGEYLVEPTGTPVSELMQGAEQQLVAANLTVQADLPVEFLDTRCDRGLAQQIADITGGQVLPPTAVEEILRLTNLEPVVAQKLESRPLWLQWKYLWLVFGCLQAEWIVRKVKGLS